METFVGIDISKNTLDICFLQNSEHRFAAFPNTLSGMKCLLKKLHSLEKIECILFEPTGGFEKEIAQFLSEANLPLHQVNPYAFKNFSRSVSACKNDRKDACCVSIVWAAHDTASKLYL